ncbi:enamine deaminase RidA (YjgF/YER057c/UK114 family) [Bacillus thermophilus]|uniref:Enamine deaminase RidA (YjgF/YER057c/UK114 family) n=1 Tax=Siminovitchia thermophila TaxID=1245522 RepID=A0ABS2R0R8_9BACI|nr:RidA family protein [Siminovitchia thermophila]MBM7713223.1 enamine deaminase RidA (YjgF/YER057c/UK114 family) [Siminovitchia thermophila]
MMDRPDIGSIAEMADTPEKKLEHLGLKLPALRSPVGSYVSCVRTGNLLFTAGQGVDEFHGKLGRDLTTEEGYLAARQSMLNLLSVVKAELGELSKVKRIVKVLGMVNSTEDFTDQPAVMNGASDLLGQVFGDKGKHGRSAVGMAQLPNNTAIEIEMILEVEGGED